MQRETFDWDQRCEYKTVYIIQWQRATRSLHPFVHDEAHIGKEANATG